VLSLRDQCAEAGVSFFFKQWGGVRKSTTGRSLDGRTYDELPNKSAAAVAPRRHRLSMLNEVSAWEALAQPA
jgi:hypothetical protein